MTREQFRTSPKYRDRPAAADIAFCVAALVNGIPEDRIERALQINFLSRDPSPSRRAAYIRRTLAKARAWVYTEPLGAGTRPGLPVLPAVEVTRLF